MASLRKSVGSFVVLAPLATILTTLLAYQRSIEVVNPLIKFPECPGERIPTRSLSGESGARKGDRREARLLPLK